jgi:vacuolar-type H+-ATPase subunit F/Vma7
MKRIAVIGRTDSIDYFRVLGCKTFHVEGGKLDEERLAEIMDGGFAVIFVTEEIFSGNRDLFGRNLKGMLPVVSIIPDIAGSNWEEGEPESRGVALEELRRAIVHAVGQDISNVEG